MPTSMGSRRSSHAIKQLSVTKDDSFEEEEESEAEEVSISQIPLNILKICIILDFAYGSTRMYVGYRDKKVS